MLERDLQDFLFENPEILFPGETIGRKRREVFIEGRRIDLLFEIADVQYIVELKRDTIRREDIGQLLEYYGLMRQSNETARFKMILVAPSIPPYRRIPLEEFGIRCVEVPHQPDFSQERFPAATLAGKSRRPQPDQLPPKPPAASPNSLSLEAMLPPVTARSLALGHLLMQEGLSSVSQSFPEYEVLPVKMSNVNSPDVLCFPEAHASQRFSRGGLWWAYSFGHTEEMPKNDLPNISVNALPWGLDFAVNAELRTSQEVMRRRVGQSTQSFDRLVKQHGSLELQVWLKFEHQPRFYHWILLTRSSQGAWQAADLLELHHHSQKNFPELRTQWFSWIRERRKDLTPAQSAHMDRTNRKLNLAFRLVDSFGRTHRAWSQPYAEQKKEFEEAYRRLKPLIDFFQQARRQQGDREPQARL